MPPLSDKELEERLTAAGNSLLQPPSPVEELLPLLDVSHPRSFYFLDFFMFASLNCLTFLLAFDFLSELFIFSHYSEYCSVCWVGNRCIFLYVLVC